MHLAFWSWSLPILEGGVIVGVGLLAARAGDGHPPQLARNRVEKLARLIRGQAAGIPSRASSRLVVGAGVIRRPRHHAWSR